jgi:hypothetical protein
MVVDSRGTEGMGDLVSQSHDPGRGTAGATSSSRSPDLLRRSFREGMVMATGPIWVQMGLVEPCFYLQYRISHQR